jgi:hypothetical protein
MSSSTSDPFPLATEQPYTGNDGDANSGAVDVNAGAAGTSTAAAGISQTAMIAIIVVVSVVGVLGSTSRTILVLRNAGNPPPCSHVSNQALVSMAVLFYLTKKREWKLREKMRRSARKVVTALTPRRSEFPRSVKEGSGRSGRGRVRLDDVPPTPRLRPEDLEKGLAKSETNSTSRPSPDGRKPKWPRK